MRTPHLRLILRGRGLELCHLDFVSDPPSSLLTFVVANEQGGDEGESVDDTDRMSDNMINDPFFADGG
jgi:hypothetical protein